LPQTNLQNGSKIPGPAKLEAEIQRLTAGLATGVHSPAVMGEIAKRESEISRIAEQVLGSGPESVEGHVANLREFVHSRLANIRRLLYADVGAARAELSRHIDRIVMRPAEVEGKRCYIASGEWSLLGKEKGPLTSTAQSNLEMVAGVGFEPTTSGL
jgi:hypothetical protein